MLGNSSTVSGCSDSEGTVSPRYSFAVWTFFCAKGVPWKRGVRRDGKRAGNKLREIIPVPGFWIDEERCTRRDEAVINRVRI